VPCTNGAGPAPAATGSEAQKNGTGERRESSKPSPNRLQVWSLRRGRSQKCLVQVVPDDESPPLHRVAWPDIGLSQPANLTRCKDAARQWAERSFLTDHRKINAARRLKSLDNFSWSASPIENSGQPPTGPRAAAS
jgi:hypothetical protein